MKWILVIVLAVSSGAALGADRAADASAAERAAAWLDARMAGIHASAPAGAARLAHDTAHEVHGRLVAEGLDEALADALTPSLTEGASTGREINRLEAAQRRLHAFARAAAQPLPPVSAGARAEMERILSDPVFDLKPRSAGPLERVVATIRRILFDVLSTVMDVASTHVVLAIMIVLGIIAAALALFVSKLVRALRTVRRPSSPVPASAAAIGGEGVDPYALIAWARDSAAAGRGRAAIKLLERASVIALRNRGDIPPDPGLTDLEAVRWLGQRGTASLRTSFERLSSLHDAIVYGGRDAATDAVDEAAALAQTLVAGIPEPAS